MLQGSIEFAAKLIDTAAQAGQFDEQLPDHALERRDIVGQRAVRVQEQGVHALFNTASGPG
jgi:hypothetical protein